MARFPSGPFGQVGVRPLDYRAGESEVTVAQFFNAVYAWMAVGLAVTAAVAHWVAMTSPLALMNPLALIGIVIAQLILVVTIRRAVNSISASAATALFLLYACLNGLMFSVLFLIYKLPTLRGTFMVTAGMRSEERRAGGAQRP